MKTLSCVIISLSPGFILIDQPIGRQSCEVYTSSPFSSGRIFWPIVSQFHTPLIKTKDVPDNALYKDFVLIQGDQTAEATWRYFFQQDRISRPVAFKHFKRCKHLQSLRRFCPAFFNSATTSSLVLPFINASVWAKKLDNKIGWCSPNGLWTLCRGNKITRDQACSLVNQLIKSVLTIGAGLTPDNGAGFIIDCLAVAVYVFAIAFHIALLEISSKAVHILIVRQNGLGFRIKKIIVPNTNQPQDHRILFSNSAVFKMLVACMCASKQFLKLSKPTLSAIDKPIALHKE